MATADRWYFAYGSNLSKQRMMRRTGPIRKARVARLNDYRLAFNNTDKAGSELYANIVPSAGGITWGVAYWCSPQAMAALDEYEGVADGCYRREWIEVETSDGERLQAEVYIGGEQFTVAEGRPERLVFGYYSARGERTRIAGRIYPRNRVAGEAKLKKGTGTERRRPEFWRIQLRTRRRGADSPEFSIHAVACSHAASYRCSCRRRRGCSISARSPSPFDRR